MEILSKNNGKALVKISKKEFEKISEKYDLSKEAGVRDWISGVGGGVADAFKGIGERGNISSIIGDTQKIIHSISSTMARIAKSYESSKNKSYRNYYAKLYNVLGDLHKNWNQKVVEAGIAQVPAETAKPAAATPAPAPTGTPAVAPTTAPAGTASGATKDIVNTAKPSPAKRKHVKKTPAVASPAVTAPAPIAQTPEQKAMARAEEYAQYAGTDYLNNKLSIVLAEKLKK